MNIMYDDDDDDEWNKEINKKFLEVPLIRKVTQFFTLKEGVGRKSRNTCN